MQIKFSRRGAVLGVLAGLVPGAATAADFRRFSPAVAGGGALDHGAFDPLLRRYARSSPDDVTRVSYRSWKASPSDLGALGLYLRQLQSQDPMALTRAEQFAFWINLYNAETLRLVLEAYPVRSILSIRPTLLSIGPWKEPTLVVAGQDLSLHDVENRILRPMFRDPRLHYALNCASVGCPNLKLTAWRAGDLDRDLSEAARTYVNHPRGVRQQAGGLRLSSIYKWYREDFGGSDVGVLAHLRRHAREPLQTRLGEGARIVGHGYDWSLNDTAS